jgi:hypothetical protein
MRVIMLFLNIGFGILTIVKLTFLKIKAKLTGKPFDNGMDM